MKKIVVIPDSFKGSMSSDEVCHTISDVFKRRVKGIEVVAIPVADGGEGSVDAFLKALGGQKITAIVQGPYGEEREAFYGILPDGTAVIEMAAAAGLTLVEGNLNPLTATTYGLGQLMLHALDSGCKKLIVGMGGSATNDGGAGAAAAVGVRFINKNGGDFVPTGGTLVEVADIDISAIDPRIGKTAIIAMADIDNPLTGPEGAAHIFGPQKGATPTMIEQLDAGLVNFADVIEKSLGKKLATYPGAGAAGGLGAGMMAFFGATLQMGIDTVLELVEFEKVAQDANLIITGEGKLDEQSLRGKVVVGVAEKAKKLKAPVLAVVGDADLPLEALRRYGIAAVFSINRLAVPYSEAKHRSRKDLQETIENIVQLILLSQGKEP